MSNDAINWALEIPVFANTKLLLLVLANYANPHNVCWPGLEKLTQICGLARSSVNKHMKQLAQLGIITKESRYDDKGHRTSNLYRLHLELSPELLRSKILSSKNDSLCPDLPPDYVRNLTPNHKQPLEKPKTKVSASSVTKNIFQHWQKILKHPKAKFDRKRKATIDKALQLGYSEDDLKMAIAGCAKNPFNMGNNDRNQKYDDINLILRDAEHIERFIEYYKNPSKQKNAGNNPWQGGI